MTLNEARSNNMITNLTQQDLLSMTTESRNKIIERLVTKYDVQSAADSARDRIMNSLNAMHMENQAVMRQANAQRDQLWRKTAALEMQVSNLQREVAKLTQSINQLLQP
jgi:hypothetical protein